MVKAMEKIKGKKKTEEGKQRKTALLSNFLQLEDILRNFVNIIKEQFCGYTKEPSCYVST
jgi:hypothetical protein